MLQEILKEFNERIKNGICNKKRCCIKENEKELRDFVTHAYNQGLKQIHDVSSLKERIPMGVTQWKEHGKKNSYDKYFNIIWPKE